MLYSLPQKLNKPPIAKALDEYPTKHLFKKLFNWNIKNVEQNFKP